MHPRLRLIKELIEMIKNWIIKLFEHRYSKHFLRDFKDAFIKTLANAFAGIVLIGFVYYLTPKDFLNRLSNTFEKYVKVQEDINNAILKNFKKHEVKNDSIKTKTNKQK